MSNVNKLIFITKFVCVFLICDFLFIENVFAGDFSELVVHVLNEENVKLATIEGIESDSISSIIIEAILLLITISVMFFILSFDWKNYLEKRKQKKLKKNKENNN